MLLGVDVGGTHTDAVLLRITGADFTVVSQAKVPTIPDRVALSVQRALLAVLENHNAADVSRFTLSSTLTTNALAQERFGPTRLVVIPGPGMDVGTWAYGLPFTTVSGSIDHRGRETSPVDPAEVERIINLLIKEGIRAVAVAGKFATRNPQHENSIGQMFLETIPAFSVSLSHSLSGVLNFPRRAISAFYNAAVRPLHDTFVDAILDVTDNLGDGNGPLLLLAHGGSVPIDASRTMCVEAANSGPAASVFGMLALERKRFAEDATVLLCDIGGSTTDLAVLVSGSPVTAREGLTLANRHTSVPGLATWSIPVGGDSPLLVDDAGRLSLGTRRQGPCCATGGLVPTVTDALNVLGYASFGDVSLSLGAVEEISEKLSEIEKKNVSPQRVAQRVVVEAAERIRDGASRFMTEINSRPVYTVARLLEGTTVTPGKICSAGGAGAAMAPVLESLFSLPVSVPEYASCANAVGAALAKVSISASLYADTARRIAYLLPEGRRFEVSSAFTADEALQCLTVYLEERASAIGAGNDKHQVEIVECDAFAMHDERGNRLGQTIRAMARLKPGLVTD